MRADEGEGDKSLVVDLDGSGGGIRDALEGDREAVPWAELSSGRRSEDGEIAALYLAGCTPGQKREGNGPNGEKTVTRGSARGVIS